MQLRVTYRVLFHVAFDVDNECRANGDGYCRLQRVSIFPPFHSSRLPFPFFNRWNLQFLLFLPLSHSLNTNSFNGWGVTLLDYLDTMCMVGLHDNFRDASGLWGMLFFLCRSYVLLTLPLYLSFLLTFPLSRLPSLPVTSCTSPTSPHPLPFPAKLLRLPRNRHVLPSWRPLSTRTSSFPILCSKTDDLGRLLFLVFK